MEAITVGQIINFITILAGLIGSVTAICAVVNKMVHKKISTEMEDMIKPINQALAEIKAQNEELKEQGDDTKQEVILMMKLNQTMINELQTLGHTNGATTAALQELNDYLINK